MPSPQDAKTRKTDEASVFQVQKNMNAARWHQSMAAVMVLVEKHCLPKPQNIAQAKKISLSSWC
jgi:hypothetical protein